MTTALKRLINKAPPYVSRSYSLPLLGGLGFGSNMESQMRAMTSLGTLFAIVDSFSEAVGAVKWGLYRTDGEEEVPDHPAAQLWEHPNPFYDNTDFVQTCQQHYDLAGEMVWNVSYNSRSSMPLELWPIRPDRAAPVPSADAFIAGWIYSNGGERIPWTTREVIQVKRPSPLDPYRGISPVASVLADVYGEQAASAYNNAFFRNSAEPGGIIQVDKRLDDTEWEELTSRWREQHQGVENAHRVAVLEKATWVERKYTHREMQFSDLRKLNREFIRQAFRYPKAMLGDTEDVNKANAQAAAWYFKDWLIQPRVEKIRSALNNKLLPLFGTSAVGFEFRYGIKGNNEIAEDDRELQITAENSRAERVKVLVEAGVDLADALKENGFPPMKAAPTPEPAPALPSPDDEPPAQNRVGRRRIADDPGAAAIWREVERLRADHPSLTNEMIATRLSISDRQFYRYQTAFEP